MIFGAGMGLPYFSTDTTAAQRALRIGADVVLMAKAVDGVFTADPRTHPTPSCSPPSRTARCRPRPRRRRSTAFSLCMDNGMPILVFNLSHDGNIALGGRG